MVNFFTVLALAVGFMVLGFVWYGPLFGKIWMRIIAADTGMISPEQKKEMQKKMGPVYLLNFVLVIITLGTLGFVISDWSSASGPVTALLVWFGFIMPMAASAAMWSGKPRTLAWQMFFLTAGYQFVCFIIAGAVLAAGQ